MTWSPPHYALQADTCKPRQEWILPSLPSKVSAPAEPLPSFVLAWTPTPLPSSDGGALTPCSGIYGSKQLSTPSTTPKPC